MPWNITLRCDCRYQVEVAPDLSRPAICPRATKGEDRPHGLKMIVQATEALWETAQAHNAVARERMRREDRLTRRRATAERRAKVARGEVPPDASL